MSRRTSAAANGAASKYTDGTPSPQANDIPNAALDKQKILFSPNAGHFSLIRALHLADLITELNGLSLLSSRPIVWPYVPTYLYSSWLSHPLATSMLTYHDFTI